MSMMSGFSTELGRVFLTTPQERTHLLHWMKIIDHFTPDESIAVTRIELDCIAQMHWGEPYWRHRPRPTMLLGHPLVEIEHW